MAKSLTTVKNRESVIKEIEKALLEINLAESAFQWAQNNQRSGFGHNEETSSRGVF